MNFSWNVLCQLKHCNFQSNVLVCLSYAIACACIKASKTFTRAKFKIMRLILRIIALVVLKTTPSNICAPYVMLHRKKTGYLATYDSFLGGIMQRI